MYDDFLCFGKYLKRFFVAQNFKIARNVAIDVAIYTDKTLLSKSFVYIDGHVYNDISGNFLCIAVSKLDAFFDIFFSFTVHSLTSNKIRKFISRAVLSMLLFFYFFSFS